MLIEFIPRTFKVGYYLIEAISGQIGGANLLIAILRKSC